MGTVSVISETRCELGEGPLWHPLRNELFWFDVLGCRLYSIANGLERHWQFDETVSACGWIDGATLLVAGASRLFAFDVESGRSETVCLFEPGNDVTRSNDGRADPWGGFWIGSMGKHVMQDAGERGAGAIWRYWRGEMVLLYPDISIANAICFAPDRSCAYFTDTMRRRVYRQALDPSDGFPVGEKEVFLDLRAEGLNPDGAVVDAQGCIWNAQWGAGRVARYDAKGRLLDSIDLPAWQTSCPAFGGPDMSTLFVTSAALGLDGDADGKTFAVQTSFRGLPEHQVTL
jgi:sugar lactone lactonase YvrE